MIGDLDEVRAAVTNLVDNAVKYSGPEVHVVVETERVENRFVIVRVSDSGPGIPKTELKRVFRRFYRVPGPLASRVKGTGLGLVHRALGGQAARRARVGGERRARTRQHVRAATSDRAMSRILVVEDELHLAEGLRFNLEAEGYQVDVVETGEAALERLMAVERALRRGGAGRDAAGQGRLHGDERNAAGRAVHPDPDADGARPCRRHPAGLRGGGRRLPDQAVRTGDPDRAHSRIAAPPRVAERVAAARARATARRIRIPSRSATSRCTSTCWNCTCATRCFR